MKILHIASFLGNIGDNASHLGFYNILNQIKKDYVLEKLEIRKFYQNYKKEDKKFFDEEFIEFINTFDICFIGGGGFLDYWVLNSKTGTTIDIDPKLIAKIKIPTYITSMGCNPNKEVPDGNIEKFQAFLNEVNKSKYIKIAVRNDGSVESIKKDIGKEYLKNINEILDHGFFYQSKSKYSRIIKEKYVAINITYDQILMNSSFKQKFDRKEYLKQLRKTILFLIESFNYKIVFVPHIYSDLKAISELLEILDDSTIRNYITVSSCIQGDDGADYLFSVYKNSELVIGTRFHTNVCSIAMNKKTIGLVALDRVEYLYRFLGIENRAVFLEGEFSEKIINIIKNESFFENKKLKKMRDKTLKFYEDELKGY